MARPAASNVWEEWEVLCSDRAFYFANYEEAIIWLVTEHCEPDVVYWGDSINESMWEGADANLHLCDKARWTPNFHVIQPIGKGATS